MSSRIVGEVLGGSAQGSSSSYLDRLGIALHLIAIGSEQISQNVKENAERNSFLTEERNTIQGHFQHLKGRMHKFREAQAKRLCELTQVAPRLACVSEIWRSFSSGTRSIAQYGNGNSGCFGVIVASVCQSAASGGVQAAEHDLNSVGGTHRALCTLVSSLQTARKKTGTS